MPPTPDAYGRHWLLGEEARVYYSTTLVEADFVSNGIYVDPTDYVFYPTAGAARLIPLDNTRNVNVTIAADRIDTTTAVEAAKGYRTSINSPRSYTVEFELRWRAAPISAVVTPEIEYAGHAFLKDACLHNRLVTMCLLDQDSSWFGAQGLLANWYVELTKREPMGGLQMSEVALHLAGTLSWVWMDDGELRLTEAPNPV